MADIPTFTLEQARELVGITQSELARRAGVGRDVISDIERGDTSRPSWETVGKLVRALRDAGLVGLQPEQIWPLDVPAHSITKAS